MMNAPTHVAVAMSTARQMAFNYSDRRQLTHNKAAAAAAANLLGDD